MALILCNVPVRAQESANSEQSQQSDTGQDVGQAAGQQTTDQPVPGQAVPDSPSLDQSSPGQAVPDSPPLDQSSSDQAVPDSPSPDQSQQLAQNPQSDQNHPPRSREDIVVVAERIRGSVVSAQAPVLELDADEIEGYGVNSVAELVETVQQQTSSGRGGGPPVFLVNGIRISSFRELRNYPPEAILKVEVLPEETAQQFGYPPDRQVMNFILKESFSSRDVEVEYGWPSRGDYGVNEQEFGLLTIAEGGRLNLQIEAQDTSLLTEDERGIIQSPQSISDISGDPTSAPYRSLRPDTRELKGSASWTKADLDNGSSVSLNSEIEQSHARSLFGLNTLRLTDAQGNTALRLYGENDPLESTSRTNKASASVGYTEPMGDFQLTTSLDSSHTDTVTYIDERADGSAYQAGALAGTLALDAPLPLINDAGQTRSHSKISNALGKASLRGSPLLLPAGEMQTTFDLGYDWGRINSLDGRATSGNTGSTGSAGAAGSSNSGAGRTVLTRGNFQGGANVSLPLTSRRDNVLAGIGTLTLNGQARFNSYSDFGTLWRFTGGVTWDLTETLQLSGSYSSNESPPSLSQLGAPQVVTENVPTYDFVNGSSVLITSTSGGNGALRAQKKDEWKFSAQLQVPKIENMRLRLDYARSDTRDSAGPFPALTSAVEAALPDRVTRDNNGLLIALDRRPINYARTQQSWIWGNVVFSGTIGATKQPPDMARGGRGGREARGARGGPRGSGARGESAGAGGRGGGAEGAGSDAANGARAAGSTTRGAASDAAGGARAAGAATQRAANTAGAASEKLGSASGEASAENSEKTQATAQRNAQGQPVDSSAEAKASASSDEGAARPMQDGEPQAEGRGSGQAGSGQAGSGQAGGGQSGGNQAGGPRTGSRQGGGGRAGGRGAAMLARMQGRGNSPTRYFFSLYSWQTFKSTTQILDGGQVLDALAGDTVGGTGSPRRGGGIQAGLFGNGRGMRLSVNYQGSSRKNGGTQAGVGQSSESLYFGDLATMDLRVFANLGQIFGQENGPLKGVRMSMHFNNIFDGHRSVRDQNGAVPINYQPQLLDPLGRNFKLELRKRF